MASDPHEAVDFAPAWLNFNNSNKKKTDKTSRISSATSISAASFVRPSHEPSYRANSFNPLRSSPSRSINTSHWNNYSPHNVRSQSVDFSPSYISSKTEHSPLSPNREYKKNYTKSGTFSPTLLPPSKRDFSVLSWQRNGPTLLHRSSGTGDGGERLDTEFPSLSEKETEQNKLKNLSHGSPGAVVNMWQKPLKLKAKEPEKTTDLNSPYKSDLSSSIYKTLVPKSSHQKPSYRRTVSVPVYNSGNSPAEIITSGSKREHSAIGRQHSPSFHPNTSNILQPKSEISMNVAIVDLGVVSGHKKHRKGKNHFLKALRQTEGENDSAGGVRLGESMADDNSGEENFDDSPNAHSLSSTIEEEPMFEGTHIEISDEGNISNGQAGANFGLSQAPVTSFNSEMLLSSSLEAEHRLLREMGWKCSDEQATEEAPLTEDEIREFRVKCNRFMSAPATGQREQALQNAFSEWKFTGIRKRSTDSDNNNEYIFHKTAYDGYSQDEDSSDDDL